MGKSKESTAAAEKADSGQNKSKYDPYDTRTIEIKPRSITFKVKPATDQTAQPIKKDHL